MIRLDDVRKIYTRRGESVTAFQCDRLTIEQGDYVAVVGPSGSGKTTLLSLLGGMLSPTAGKVEVADVSLYDVSPAARAALRRERMGFVFQTFNLVPYLTALENVQLPLCLAGLPSAEQAARATEMLERFGLGERLGHKPTEMSVGQQQRTALARTLVNNPRIILADEPTGNLDTRTSIEVMGIFQRLNREKGITVLLITHEMDIAEYGTRLIRFRDGRVVADQKVLHRRDAAEELAALPPPEPDLIPAPAEPDAQPAH